MVMVKITLLSDGAIAFLWILTLMVRMTESNAMAMGNIFTYSNVVIGRLFVDFHLQNLVRSVMGMMQL
jgi:hypothetical protein